MKIKTAYNIIVIPMTHEIHVGVMLLDDFPSVRLHLTPDSGIVFLRKDHDFEIYKIGGYRADVNGDDPEWVDNIGAWLSGLGFDWSSEAKASWIYKFRIWVA